MSRSANKKNISKSGGLKKETVEFWEEQPRVNLRFFFGAGGHERSSGIRNFCPLGVEQMLLGISVFRPASVTVLAAVEMEWNSFDDSLVFFDRRRRFLYWVLLLFLPAGAIEKILGLFLWQSWWRIATKNTLGTDLFVSLESLTEYLEFNRIVT